MKRLPYLTCILSLAALAMYAMPGANPLFEFSRVGMGRLELWRVITGHFTHFGLDHLRWDLAVFVAFGSLAESKKRRSFIVTMAVAAIAISVAILIFQPQVKFYRGLSGLDSALFGLIMSGQLIDGWVRRQPVAVALSGVAGLGFGAKTAYEVTVGQPVFVESASFLPMPLAHLVGFLTAALIAFHWRTQRQGSPGLNRSELVV